jgi:predicted dehydrogenase
MRQVLQSLKTGQVLVEEVPVPATAERGVLVRARASVVSAGTERMVVEFAEKNLLQKARARPDLVRQVLQKARREGLLSTFDAVTRKLDEPFPLGYSLVGEVIDVGAETRGVRRGDLVACAGAGIANHAEFAAVPQNLFTVLPAGFADRAPIEHAAFSTIGAIALHGFRLADAGVGDRVAVIGLGLIGQLAAQIATAAGCRVFGVDLSPARLALARELGIGEAVLREEAEARGSAFTGGAGFDAVLIAADATSRDPIELAGALARDRAEVVALGAVDLTLPRKVFFAKELGFRVSRSYGPGRYDPEYELHGRDYPIGYVRWTEQRNLGAFVDLLASGRVRVAPLISHRFDVAEAPKAYDLITGKAGEPFLGVLLTYPEDAPVGRRLDLPAAAAPAIARTGALGVSVLGSGLFAGATMVPALKAVSGVTLRGIVSGQGLTARSLGAANGFAFSATDAAEVWRDAATDVVFILTRHHLHADQVSAALEAGKHVFVEKPLCLTAAELVALDALAATRPGQHVLVGFNRRFAPMAERLRAFVDTGEPRLVTYRVNAGYLPPEHWTQDPAQGGGRLLGEACHFIDFANWLHGEPPASVYARAADDAGKYRQDNLVVTLAYPSGGVATIVYAANGDKAAGKERIEVTSGGRLAILEDFRRLELHRDGRTEVVRDRLRADKGHGVEVQRFLEAIRRGAAPVVPFAELAASTRSALAAQASLTSGLPVDPAGVTTDD